MDTQAIKRDYDRDGYAIVRGLIDGALVAEAREHIEFLQRKYPELRPEELHHPLIRDDAFWALRTVWW